MLVDSIRRGELGEGVVDTGTRSLEVLAGHVLAHDAEVRRRLHGYEHPAVFNPQNANGRVGPNSERLAAAPLQH
jgi:hypothetical protein